VFGRYGADFSYSDKNITISVERTGTPPRYVRACRDERIEKILPTGEGSVIINPVEPVNLPLPITRLLEIAFPATVLLPKSERRVFLTFPVEIGVFLEAGGDLHVLDIFSCTPAKYSLYGLPGTGQITRWHRSEVYEKAPVTDRFFLGVLDLTLKNTSAETIEVSRTVLDSNSMHLSYGEYVSMKAVMEVYSPMIARTSVDEVPSVSGMTPCIELYIARRIPAVHGRGHLMESGVA
jgi:hypothetical protein